MSVLRFLNNLNPPVWDKLLRSYWVLRVTVMAYFLSTWLDWAIPRALIRQHMGLHMKAFPGMFTWELRPTQNVGIIIPWAKGPDWIKMWEGGSQLSTGINSSLFPGQIHGSSHFHHGTFSSINHSTLSLQAWAKVNFCF